MAKFAAGDLVRITHVINTHHASKAEPMWAVVAKPSDYPNGSLYVRYLWGGTTSEADPDEIEEREWAGTYHLMPGAQLVAMQEPDADLHWWAEPRYTHHVADEDVPPQVWTALAKWRLTDG